MRRISKYLTLERAVYSDTARIYNIKNEPDKAEIENLIRLGGKIYDPVVEQFGLVFPSSVFRSKALNTHPKVGGSAASDHVKGRAIDLDGDAPNKNWASVDNNKLFHWIRKNLKFDQLIAEFELNGRPKWIHVGYREGSNRGIVLIATKNNRGKTVYLSYTDNLYKNIYKFDPKTEIYLNSTRSFGFAPTFELQEFVPDAHNENINDEFWFSEKSVEIGLLVELVENDGNNNNESSDKNSEEDNTNCNTNDDGDYSQNDLGKNYNSGAVYSLVEESESIMELSLKFKNFPGLNKPGEDPEIVISVKKPK